MYWICFPNVSWVIEGNYDPKRGKFFYDIYSMCYDKRTGETFNYRVLVSHVPVQVMYRKAEKQVKNLRQQKGR